MVERRTFCGEMRGLGQNMIDREKGGVIFGHWWEWGIR
jgi:hypothetical protein